jgi:hypothetical protein
VSEGTTASKGAPSIWRRIQQTAANQPAATAIALYAIVSIGAFLAAYFTIFNEFAPYDDEGTLLVTLKAFVQGHALYREIWSVYGPFYYELFGGFFKLFGLSITTDASRTIVLVVWVGTSLLFGVAAQRLTGRLSLGLTTMIAAFSALAVLANEPMHPQGLCVLILAFFALFAVNGLRGWIGWSGIACGALLAALLLTKVNLGIFAIAATVVALAVSVEPIYRRGWLRWLIIAAFLVMPVAVLDRDLRQAWVRELILLEGLAGIAVLVASRTIRPVREKDGGENTRWLLAAVLGFVAAFVTIVVIVLITGPSLSNVYQGVVKDALGIREVFTSQFPFPAGAALDWAIAAVVAAAIAGGVRLARRDVVPVFWTGLLRAAAGLTILCSVAHIVPVGLNPSAADPIVVPMLLVWVAAIPPAGVVETAYKRFLRVLLPLVAIAETLQVYPVPGSQVGIASAFFVAVGALCLADSWTDLQAWSEARGGSILRNFSTSVAMVAIALPAAFGLNAIVLPAMSSAVSYHELTKLKLPGAELMHLGTAQVEEYEGLVELLHKNKCTTFVGWPTVNSLYLWSGLEPPLPTIPNGWFYAMKESQQQMAVEELRASPRPCAIVNEELANFYLQGRPAPSTPLVHYVKQNFEPIEVLGKFEFELPKPSATAGG